MIEQTVTALVYLHDNYRIASAGTDGFAVFFFLDDVRSSHSAFSSNVKLWDMRRSYTVHTQRPICCEPPIPVGASGKTTGAEIPLRFLRAALSGFVGISSLSTDSGGAGLVVGCTNDRCGPIFFWQWISWFE